MHKSRSAVDRRTQIAETPWGRFHVYPDDHIGRVMADGVHYERRIVARLLQIVSDPESIAFDVGACIGAHAVAYAKTFTDGHVYAFEPNRLSMELLSKTRDENALENLSIHGVALSDHHGRAAIDTPDADNIGHTLLIDGDDLDVRTLDSYELDRLDLLKIDVEGHEGAVLRGAEATLRTCRPVIFLERNGGDWIADWLLFEHDYSRVERISKNLLAIP